MEMVVNCRGVTGFGCAVTAIFATFWGDVEEVTAGGTLDAEGAEDGDGDGDEERVVGDGDAVTPLVCMVPEIA